MNRDELVRKVAERTQGTASDPLTEDEVRKVLEVADRVLSEEPQPGDVPEQEPLPEPDEAEESGEPTSEDRDPSQ